MDPNGRLGTIEESGLSDRPSRSPSDVSVTSQGLTNSQSLQDGTGNGGDEEEEEFTYPVDSSPHGSDPIVAPVPTVSSQQLEAIFAAASAGDLPLLEKIFRTARAENDLEPFSLANEASSRTGLTPLHAASRRGHLGVVKWLINDCGAMPDLEDKEGETALHKASLHGHLEVVSFLVSKDSDPYTRDGDGWTALHNACSKGYLDIVRFICEKGGDVVVDNLRGVDLKSNGGWTPLMNASSKGHLPVVLYLLTKQKADPLLRNNWGETAYDIAAAVFEVWICEVLQKAEAERWRFSQARYDSLMVHTTVSMLLHENQKLDTRLKTLAVSGGRPKFSASGLGRTGRRAPFELRLPPGQEEDGRIDIPAWRSDVQLPLRDSPFVLPKPLSTNDEPTRGGVERSHFWLSDWTLDLTHPRVSMDGWQYARSFEDPDDQWTPEMPPQLERLLSGSGLLTPGLASGSNSVASRSSGQSSSSASTNSTSWVRRRRWVRILRRRLDIPPLPFLQPDGGMYQLTTDGTFVPMVDDRTSDFGGAEGDDGGQELGSMPVSYLAFTQDYVSRARYLAGSPHGGDGDSMTGLSSAVDMKRSIAKLQRAVYELRAGMLGDEDADRKTQAEVLLNAYSRELERLRLSAGAEGLFLVTNDDANEEDDADDSDQSFHYPSTSPTSTARPASVRSHGPSDYFSRPSTSTQNAMSMDLTPQLSQAPEFRVPTHEAPQKIHTPRWTTPTPHQVHAQWERDEAVAECRSCKRRFTFLFRKHCRRCGRIFCDRCSSHRALLDPSDVVHDPAYPDPPPFSSSAHRVCEPCFDQTNANVPSRFQGVRTSSMERIVVDQARLSLPHERHQQENSQISDLADCPVCSQNLADLGSAASQEAHVRACLEGPSGGPGIQQAGKYLVYRLPAESTLIGIECVICLEEFLKGSLVSRLSCLCTFHNACLSAWLQRGRSCPVHARYA